MNDVRPSRRPMHGRRSAALVAIALGLVAGCAPDLPELEPDAASSQPLPVLTSEQSAAVLAEIGEVLITADASLDADALGPRVGSAAQDVRRSEFRLSGATDGESIIQPLTTDAQVVVVAATEDWPRMALAVTEIPEGGTLPLLLALRQDAPRADYELDYWTRLLPGIETPAFAAPEIGSVQLAANDASLPVSPEQAIADFAALLAAPDDEELAAAFADDAYRPLLAEEFAAVQESVEVAGTAELSASVVDAPVIAMQTADGGAVVVGAVDSVLEITKTIEGATLTIGGEISQLGDVTEVEESVSATYRQMLAFHVPATADEDGDLIQLIGAERVLRSVSSE